MFRQVNHIRAENNVQSVSYLLSTQVVKPQIMHKKNTNQCKHKFTEKIHKHQTQNFRRTSPFGIAPVKKAHIRLGHDGIVADQKHESEHVDWSLKI